MRKSLALSLCLLLPGASWGAAFSSKAKGTAGGAFLKLGVGARAISMGEAYTAVADDATALYWNPAGLTRIEKRSAAFMHAAYIADSHYDYLAVGAKAGESGAAGLSVQYLSAGKFTETDASGLDVGNVTPYDLAVSAGYAHSFDPVSAGLAFKFIQSQIINTARTWAVDLGVLSKPFTDGFLADKLRLGFSALNLGGRLKYDQQAEDLPVTLRGGGAYSVNERWLLSLDAVAVRDEEPHAALGTSYLIKSGKDVDLAGRLGYNSRNEGDIDGVAGVSAGIGVRYLEGSFDYAFVPYGSVGQAHRFSISLRF